MSGRVRSLAVVTLEAALVVGYVVLFGYFVVHSADFVVARNNARATEAALARAAALPARFDFVAPSSDVALLGGGWYRQSNGMVEAPGPLSKSAAFVYLPVPANQSTTVTVLGTPFLAPGHEVVTIDVWIDGTRFGPWTARYGEPTPSISMVVPSAAASDGLLELRLDVETEAAPYQYMASRDTRKLGLRLRGITLDPR